MSGPAHFTPPPVAAGCASPFHSEGSTGTWTRPPRNKRPLCQPTPNCQPISLQSQVFLPVLAHHDSGIGFPYKRFSQQFAPNRPSSTRTYGAFPNPRAVPRQRTFRNQGRLSTDRSLSPPAPRFPTKCTHVVLAALLAVRSFLNRPLDTLILSHPLVLGCFRPSTDPAPTWHTLCCALPTAVGFATAASSCAPLCRLHASLPHPRTRNGLSLGVFLVSRYYLTLFSVLCTNV